MKKYEYEGKTKEEAVEKALAELKINEKDLIINVLEEKEGLEELIKDDESDIKVYIGNETPVESMKDCSVVTAHYEIADGVKGVIGIIGPKRMDYEMVVETLNNIRMRLDDLFSKN